MWVLSLAFGRVTFTFAVFVAATFVCF